MTSSKIIIIVMLQLVKGVADALIAYLS